MKNSQNVFCIRSPIASRPYYVTPSLDGIKKISWMKEPGYHLCEPNDMESFLPNYDNENEHNDYLQLVAITSKNRIYQNIEPSLVPNSNEIPILQLISPISPSFLCTPYFPFDLSLYDSTDNVISVLSQKMQPRDKKLKRVTEDLQISITKEKKAKRYTVDLQSLFPKDKKVKRNTDDFFDTNKNTLNLDPQVALIPGLSSLFKNIKKFILSDTLDDYQYPNNIINLIAKSEELLSECIYQLIPLIDTTKSTTSVIQSWKLMMLVIGYFHIPEPHSDNLRDFLIAAAGHDEVDFEIQYRAKICLCRLFSEHQLNIKWKAEEQNYNYIKSSMSMTQLLGVSLAEIFVKEEYKRLRSTDYNSGAYGQINKSLSFGDKKEDSDEIPVLVPLVLKKLIKAMISMNGLKNEGIFRIPGDKLVENQSIEDFNNGYWEEPSTLVITLASITKRFIRELQDPLIPDYIINMANKETPPYIIIQQINQLPSQNKETLMYLIGFLQQIADNQKLNKMNPENIAISMGDMFNNLPVIDNIKERLEKIRFVVTTLINYWNTSPVYDL